MTSIKHIDSEGKANTEPRVDMMAAAWIIFSVEKITLSQLGGACCKMFVEIGRFTMETHCVIEINLMPILLPEKLLLIHAMLVRHQLDLFYYRGSTYIPEWISNYIDQKEHPRNHNMVMSSNGNIFRVTGPLCGEYTDHRWNPRTKASDAELWCFLWSVPEQTPE